MKQPKIISTILFLFMMVFVKAQSIEKFSIDSGGASYSAGGIEILYTIGEVNVQEVNVGGITVSEGFINPEKCSGATTTWDGVSWDKGIPDNKMDAIVAGEYISSVHGNIDACEVKVNLGFVLTITAGNYVNVENNIVVDGTLLVAHEGTLVQVSDVATVTNLGSITVEKVTPTFTDRDFSIMGSPMSDETREGVYSTAAIVRYHDTNLFTPNSDVATFDPGAENFADDNGDNWQTHTGVLTVGEGYLVKPFFIGDAGGSFTTSYNQGTLNNGVVNFTTIFGDDQNDSPNILSNPYASAVDAFVFITDNAIVDAIYYWEHINIPNASYPGYNSSNYDMGDISMYNLSGGVAAANAGGGPQNSNQFIPSGQGFGIKANAAGTVVFNNAMRLTSPNNGYRNSETLDRLYLGISNETYNLKGATLIAFTEHATNDFDSNYDSKRLATPISLYSLNSNKELGIQGRVAFNEEHIIPLGFSTHVEENQEYSISISSLEGELLSQATVYLKDNLLNTLTNLSELDYTFIANQGHQTERFVIVFKEHQLGINEIGLEAISLYPNPINNILNINSPLSEIKTIEIFDLRGRKIRSINNKNQHSCQIDMTSLKSAMYFIKISTDNGTITKRVLKE